MKKTLIFDFDGTLVNSFELAFQCVNQLSDKYHYNTFDNPDFWRGKPLKDIISQDVDLNFISMLLFVRDMRKLMNKKYHTVSFFDNLIPILIRLSKDYDIGIMTTNSYHNIELLLHRYKLDFFTFIYANTSVFGKSRKLKHIIKKHHLIPEHTLYIGDEQRDIEAAYKANIASLAVTWGFNTKELLLTSSPTYIADTPQELYEIIHTYI